MYPTHAVSTTTTIKSSLHKIHSCAYCTYANQAYYSQLRMLLSDNQKTIRRWASTKCTPVYITHQMNAQRARLRPAYYSLATAGGANKIRSSTWVLSDTNKLATVQPHSAVHEQTASLQPHPKGLPIKDVRTLAVGAPPLVHVRGCRSYPRTPRARNSRSPGVQRTSASTPRSGVARRAA